MATTITLRRVTDGTRGMVGSPLSVGPIKIRCTANREARRGAGWPIGASGILTAYHNIAHHTPNQAVEAVGDEPPEEPTSSRFLVAVSDPSRGASTYSCTVIWSHPGLDLTILQVDPPHHAAWQATLSGLVPVVFAELGIDPLPVTATGFPAATLTDTDEYPAPDQIDATLLPLGGRPVTGRVPIDLITTPPDISTQWEGMSGAAVLEYRNGAHRLVAVVTDSTLTDNGTNDRERRRLHATPIPDPAHDRSFAAALAQVGITNPVLEDHHALRNRAIFDLLDPAGRPYLLSAVPQDQYGQLGPRRARTDIDQNGNPYYPYIHRRADRPLHSAVNDRANGRDSRAFILVGHPMTGKSRTLLETVRNHPDLVAAPLLAPRVDADLDQIVLIARQMAAAHARVVVWLDDIHRYTGMRRAVLRNLQSSPGVIVCGTLRSDEEAKLQEQTGAFSFLAEEAELHAHAEWTPEDIEALPATTPAVIRDGLRDGQPLGHILGAAQELLRRLSTGRAAQQALVHLIADWPRTGRTTPLVEADARVLYSTYLSARDSTIWADLTDDDQDEQWVDTLNWARRPVAGAVPLVVRTRAGLTSDPFLSGHRDTHADPPPTQLWEYALTSVTNVHDPYAEAYRVGAAAAKRRLYSLADQAYTYATEAEDDETGGLAWLSRAYVAQLAGWKPVTVEEPFRRAALNADHLISVHALFELQLHLETAGVELASGVTSDDPELVMSEFLLAEFLEQHNPDLAVKVLQRVSNLSDDVTTRVSADMQLGHLFLKRDERGRALAAFRRVKAAAQPLSAELAALNIGMLLERTDTAESDRAYRQAMTSPDPQVVELARDKLSEINKRRYRRFLPRRARRGRPT